MLAGGDGRQEYQNCRGHAPRGKRQRESSPDQAEKTLNEMSKRRKIKDNQKEVQSQTKKKKFQSPTG